MDESSCTTMAKCLLIFAGVCYLVSAGGLSYVGIWTFSTYDHFDEITDATITLLPASIILGASAFMCIIGVLAFIAAFRSSKILLAVFFCLILLVFVAEVMAFLLGLLYRREVKGVLAVDLVAALNSYDDIAYQNQIDYMQRQFECCGVFSASDWERSTCWMQNHTDTVPTSCCNSTFISTCNTTVGSGNIYPEGCLEKLSNEFGKNLISMAIAVIFLVLVQTLALIITCILVCRTRSEHHHYECLIEDIVGEMMT